MKASTHVPAAGKHGWSGSCTPNPRYYSRTFSVGVFEWIPKSSGRKGAFKKGKVKVRVCGASDREVEVYEAANEVVWALDNNTYHGATLVVVPYCAS